MPDFDALHSQLYTAVLCDALDHLGLRHQATRIPFQAFSGIPTMLGRCKTTLWVDMYDRDPDPYDVVVPRAVEDEVLRLALGKIDAENTTRDAIRGGMKATEAYQTFGIL